MEHLNPLEVSQSTIDNYRQNSVMLIIRDAREHLGLDDEQCRKLALILIARGVPKWLSNRRSIITLKNTLKTKITETIRAMHKAKKYPPDESNLKIRELRGVLKTLNTVRNDIRRICKSPRWIAGCDRRDGHEIAMIISEGDPLAYHTLRANDEEWYYPKIYIPGQER